MKKANLIFKDETPYSLDFDDYYFNSKGGLEESKFVYSESFEFKESENFTISESGFGLGLNFFLTLKRFLSSTKKPKKLFYIAFEAFYIDKETFKRSYEKLGYYDEFKEYLEPFLKFYPKQKCGTYRFYFQNCFLDLVFNDISVLPNFDFKADIWYLDGFSPKKNPQMFNESFIKEVARLSRINAQICTFSSASFLQKSLKENGFLVQKLKGFFKRQMIRAFLSKEPKTENKEAYFARVLNKSLGKKVAIIGAGISSATLAYELSLRGFELDIFEKNQALHQGASGNESGILSSLILKKNVLLGEFSQLCFVEASRFYRQVLGLEFKGVMEYAYNDLMLKRFLEQSENPLFEISQNKAFLEDGGLINPKKIVKTLFEKSGAKLHFKHEFIGFEYKNELFSLKFKDKFLQEKYDILIYALGADSKDFLAYDGMSLSKVRGQVTHLKPFLKNDFALSSKAYICPANNALQVIGASYDRLNSSSIPSSLDDKLNLENIKEFLKGDERLEILGSRVGFRSYSSDRFIIAGKFYDENFYKNEYKALLWSKQKAQNLPQNTKNLYFSFAHGSRGFSTSVLAARYLCALINNEPLTLDKSFISAIHPARFLIRKLKKGLN